VLFPGQTRLLLERFQGQSAGLEGLSGAKHRERLLCREWSRCLSHCVVPQSCCRGAGLCGSWWDPCEPRRRLAWPRGGWGGALWGAAPARCRGGRTPRSLRALVEAPGLPWHRVGQLQAGFDLLSVRVKARELGSSDLLPGPGQPATSSPGEKNQAG